MLAACSIKLSCSKDCKVYILCLSVCVDADSKYLIYWKRFNEVEVIKDYHCKIIVQSCRQTNDVPCRPDGDKQHDLLDRLLQAEVYNSLHPKLVLNDINISRSCGILSLETCSNSLLSRNLSPHYRFHKISSPDPSKTPESTPRLKTGGRIGELNPVWWDRAPDSKVL